VQADRALAAGSSATAAATPPSSAKPKPASVKQKKAAPVKNVKAPKARKPQAPKKARAAIPTKPPADIPVVTEAASVWEGCLDRRDLPALASRIGMEQTRLESLLQDQSLFESEESSCVPYVGATGGEGGAASAMFQPKSGSTPVVALRKTSDGVTVTPGACDCPEPIRRVLTAPARDVIDASEEVLAGLPANVRWQLNILAPQMIARVAGADAYTLRVTVERHGDLQPEHLQSLELLDSATGKRADGVWWLERPDGPGVFVGMEGVAYERLLWESPVKYVQISRGVGPALTTFWRRVAAPKGSTTAKPTVLRGYTVRGTHQGIDLLAAKGVEVHAVGDATVTWAGFQRGGYGNLIILDHGRGYQTYYAHLSRILPGVKAGTKVGRGDIIGLVGSTGHSTAPHLHFETRKDAKYLDPFDETRQLEFWLLTPDDQERLAMEMLAQTPDVSADSASVAVPDRTATDSNRR